MKLQRRPKLSRVKIETSDDFDIEFEDGDAIIVVQADGNVRKLYLPQMDSKYLIVKAIENYSTALIFYSQGPKKNLLNFTKRKEKEEYTNA